MPVYVSEGSTFEPHPEGQFAAVCCDVVEMHGVETPWGIKNKVRVVWQTEATRQDGKPELVSRFFTASLSEMSNLRPFLEAWRGKKFNAQELKRFDLDALVGAPAVIQVQHNESGGKVYANVTSIMLPMKGMVVPTIRDYIRVQDRPDEPAKNGAPQPVHAGHNFDHAPSSLQNDDDEMPF